MAYTTAAKVKEVLQISEVTWDTEIAACITSSDALIDSILKYHGFSVPLSSTPQNVDDASKHFAAWMFRRRRDPAGAQVFWDEGDKFLRAYIDAEKNQPYLGRT